MAGERLESGRPSASGLAKITGRSVAEKALVQAERLAHAERAVVGPGEGGEARAV